MTATIDETTEQNTTDAEPTQHPSISKLIAQGKPGDVYTSKGERGYTTYQLVRIYNPQAGDTPPVESGWINGILHGNDLVGQVREVETRHRNDFITPGTQTKHVSSAYYFVSTDADCPIGFSCNYSAKTISARQQATSRVAFSERSRLSWPAVKKQHMQQVREHLGLTISL